MGQITSAVIGITLVLVSVFVPMAFFPGTTGAIYRQFAVTLAISIAFSALMALTLTPALCATLLKPVESGAPRTAARPFLRALLRGVQRRGSPAPPADIRGWWTASCSGRCASSPCSRCLILITLVLFRRLPGSFLPVEDQGSVLTVVQAPPGATTERTNLAIEQVKRWYRSQSETQTVIFVRGFSFYGQGQANAMAFVRLKPWDERPGKDAQRDDARQPGARRADGDQGGDGVHAQSAGDPGARRGERVQLRARGPRRPHARRAARGAQPAARRGDARAPCSSACDRKARRTRRSSA